MFDLDGTLWEVFDATYEAAVRVSKRNNVKEVSREIVRSCFGLNKEECAKLYFPDVELKDSVQYIEEIIEESNKIINEKGGNLYSNLKDTLDFLKQKYELFIVSNTAQDEYIERFIKLSNTNQYFKEYIAASKLNISKSDAIKKVISDNKLDKSIYIGDTIKDMEAAENAEIPFIQALYGFGENLKTKYYINELKELPEVVEKIFE